MSTSDGSSSGNRERLFQNLFLASLVLEFVLLLGTAELFFGSIALSIS